MLEKDIENLLASYPEEFFPGENLKLIGQQVAVEGRKIDVLFEDRFNRKIIVEIKRGILTRDASGQIAEYYGLLKHNNPNQIIELILCANIIPKERKIFLETIGIECKELGVVRIAEVANKHNYQFLDEYLDKHTKTEINIERKNVTLTNSKETPSVWIFQANPQIYDILNALNDPEVGNSVHWTINQYKNEIHKGHLAIIWMSGKESGIYALARIESEPSLMEENEPEKKYWIENNGNETRCRVKLTIIKKFLNFPILKKKLQNIRELSSLSILRRFQGTNFPVRDSEWDVISRLV